MLESRGLAFVLGLGLLGLAAPALASPSLSEAWFVRAKDSTVEAMLTDRDYCVHEAEQFGIDRASDFSNPDYGSLSAMGAALNDDALNGDAKQAVRRAVRDACMSKRGWTRVDVAKDEAKLLKKASVKRPEALQAWMKANAGKAAPPPAPAAVAIPVKSETPAASAAPVVDAGKLQEVTPPPTAAPAAPAASGSAALPVDAGRLQEVSRPAEAPAPHA